MVQYDVSARMKSGHPSYEPSISRGGVPESFYECQRRWERTKHLDRWRAEDFRFVRSVIEPELTVILHPDSEQIAGGLTSDGLPIVASMVEVDSVCFAEGPIPIINARTRWTILFDRRFPNYDSWIGWQEEYGWLDGSVEFQYRFKISGTDNIIRADCGSTGIQCELFYNGVSLLTAA